MKLPITLTFLLASLLTVTVKAEEAYLPQLNIIESTILTANADGVYFSSYSKAYQEPDLWAYVRQNGKLMVTSGSRGSLTLIADLGERNLEEISYVETLSQNNNPQEPHQYSYEKDLIIGHVYVLVMNTMTSRGIVSFKVESLTKTRVALTYAVNAYMAMKAVNMSEGFNANEGNIRRKAQTPGVQDPALKLN